MSTTIEGALPREEDLGNRREYLGWSEIGTALNYNRYQDAYGLWRVKVGLDEPTANPEYEQARRMGHRLEPVIAEEYSLMTGRKVYRPEPGGVAAFPDAPWLVGHPDYLVETNGEPSRYLECKATGTRDYGDPGTDDVNKGHYAQALGGCTALDLDFCDIGAMTRPTFVGIYYVARDDELWREVFKRLAIFWGLVQTKTPPEPKHLESLKLAWPEPVIGEYKEMTTEDLVAFATYLHWQKTESMARTRKNEQGLYLKQRVGKAEGMGLYSPEMEAMVPFFRYPCTAGRTSIKRILAARPELEELVAQHTDKVGPRTFQKTADGNNWYKGEGMALIEDVVRGGYHGE